LEKRHYNIDKKEKVKKVKKVRGIVFENK